MKTIFTFCVLFYFISINTIQSQTKDINFSGTVDSSIIETFQSDTLFIKIYDAHKALLNSQDILKIPLNSSGRFSVKISPSSKRTYLSFWMSKKNGKGNLVRINYQTRFFYLDEMYLFEQADSVDIRFEKDGVINFQGKGAEKLQCQYKIYAMQIKSPNGSSIVTELLNEKKYLEALDFQREGLEHAIKMRLKILKSYRAILREEIYQTLYLDAISSAEYECIYPLWIKTMTPFEEESMKAQMAVQQYFLEHRMSDFLNEENKNFILDSGYFTDYLFEKEWNYYKLFTQKPLSGNSFKDIYTIIKSKYKGHLQYRLLMICLRKLNRYFSYEIVSNVSEIQNDFKNSSYENTINTWISKFSRAYPFELEDVNGKIHRLNDYKGKVIVMDFWFTGCQPCIKLNRGMHEIMRNYRKRKDIVFITVSMDKNKEKWLQSVRSGLYTSPGTINLYTNGKGVVHPILIHYNFKGAPHQLIYDKKGNFIVSDPPKPYEAIRLEFDKGRYAFESSESLKSPNSKLFMKILDGLLK